MEQIEERSFLILNALYLRKIADRDVLAECSGCAAADVDGILDVSAATGFVLGLGSQYVLTDEGRQAVLDYYAATYEDVRADPEIQDWYVKFETVNDRFLQLVSAWQTSGDRADGQDRVYDRLARTVERQVTALEQVADRLPRYRHYADRFRKSLDRVDSGQVEYVTSPTVDSLHNIWFEFHEDILTVLGRPRDVAEGHA